MTVSRPRAADHSRHASLGSRPGSSRITCGATPERPSSARYKSTRAASPGLPTLLIFGGRDRYTSSRRELPRLQQLFPHNEAVVIPGAGHFFPESAGEAMAAAMRDYLARGDQSSPRRKVSVRRGTFTTGR